MGSLYSGRDTDCRASARCSGIRKESVIPLSIRIGASNKNGDELPGAVHRRFVFTNGSTLFADPSGGTAATGASPAERVPQVSFLTILSIAGRKAGFLTVTSMPDGVL
jgi:hypothetical protein